jgi:hypothetical protein
MQARLRAQRRENQPPPDTNNRGAKRDAGPLAPERRVKQPRSLSSPGQRERDVKPVPAATTALPVAGAAPSLRLDFDANATTAAACLRDRFGNEPRTRWRCALRSFDPLNLGCRK